MIGTMQHQGEQMENYQSFIMSKSASVRPAGHVASMSDTPLFPFQKRIVEMALRVGRFAIFADTGLGKGPMLLFWAEEVMKHTGRSVLVMAPLAVVEQLRREASKFGVSPVSVVRDSGEMSGRGIYITNYERLHLFDGIGWGGIVLDESSILKNTTGRKRNQLIEYASSIDYRLCCSATPAPNDYTELGNHSQFLGVMDEAIMRARWFINDLNETVAPWRLKGHAEDDFWRWVSSWSRCVGKPSDVGDYDDEMYQLPTLHRILHHVSVDLNEGRDNGMLFRIPDLSATAVHKERRRTAAIRAEKVVDLIRSEPNESWVVWVDTNYDQDALLPSLDAAGVSAIVVEGSMSPEAKAEGLLRFVDEGGVIVTKPSIAGMGLNWQHSARMAFMGGSYSYEQFYQAVRREWRFGQTREVYAHVVMAKTEAAMWSAIHRKSEDHERMKVKMFAASRKASRRFSNSDPYNPTHTAAWPGWLRTLEM